MSNANNNPNAGPSRQNQYREPHQSYMVFVTEPNDKQSQYRRAMEVNAVMPAVPKFMYWSEDEIGWSIKDHPKVMPNPGGYALVVDLTFVGPSINVRFSRVLVDNGSSINIMYQDTMVNREYDAAKSDHLPRHRAGCFACTHGHSLGRCCLWRQKLLPD